MTISYVLWAMPKFVLTMEPGPEEMGKHEDAESLFGDSDLLRSLCRKEVERFEQYCRATDPNFSDGGFVRIEAWAIEGYLYQKLKGHIDAHHKENLLPKEGQDGTA